MKYLASVEREFKECSRIKNFLAENPSTWENLKLYANFFPRREKKKLAIICIIIRRKFVSLRLSPLRRNRKKLFFKTHKRRNQKGKQINLPRLREKRGEEKTQIRFSRAEAEKNQF
jgi:hypothetical protein